MIFDNMDYQEIKRDKLYLKLYCDLVYSKTLSSLFSNESIINCNTEMFDIKLNFLKNTDESLMQKITNKIIDSAKTNFAEEKYILTFDETFELLNDLVPEFKDVDLYADDEGIQEPENNDNLIKENAENDDNKVQENAEKDENKVQVNAENDENKMQENAEKVIDKVQENVVKPKETSKDEALKEHNRKSYTSLKDLNVSFGEKNFISLGDFKQIKNYGNLKISLGKEMQSKESTSDIRPVEYVPIFTSLTKTIQKLILEFGIACGEYGKAIEPNNEDGKESLAKAKLILKNIEKNYLKD